MTTIPATTVPRSRGHLRPASRIEPGWWVHLFDDEGDPPGTWELVVSNEMTRSVRVIGFASGETHDLHHNIDLVTLTDVEASRLGLTAGAA